MSPLAERRAAALSLDSTLLAELLGRVELRELLDPDVIAATGRQLQHLSADRAARDAEARRRSAAAAGPADRGRDCRTSQRRRRHRRRRLAGGPACRPACADRVVRRPQLVGGRRGHRTAARRRRGGRPGGPAGRLHRGGGRPAGRTAGPLRAHPHAVHHRRRPPPDSVWGYGWPPTCWAVWRATAGWCAASSLPAETSGAGSEQWCDADVLRILRRRSLAALRAQVEPVSTAAYGRFLPAWHQVGDTSQSGASGLDGLASVIDQLAGVRIPASALEPLVLSPRVRDYSPALLDELLATGEVTWSGAGSISGSDGWIALAQADSAAADAGSSGRNRVHRCPPGDPGQLVRRRRVLLPPAHHARTQRGGPQSRTVGTDLGRLGHRRHLRPGPRAAGSAARAPASVPRRRTEPTARRG